MCDPCCGPFEPKGCRSRELRCGILYTTCDCIKRNGMQDKCPRSACQGRPSCMCSPTPNCCPASFPLRFANMTMGVNNKRMRCAATAATCGGGGGLPRSCGGCCNGGGCGPCGPCGPCGGGCGPCGPCGPCGGCSPCGGCGPCNDCPCCGPHSPPCGAPAPIPCSPAPGCCAPPLPEGGIPDPRVWNCCNTPPTYPCGCCPMRYLKPKQEDMCCVWCAPCKAHCYNTPGKCCC